MFQIYIDVKPAMDEELPFEYILTSDHLMFLYFFTEVSYTILFLIMGGTHTLMMNIVINRLKAFAYFYLFLSMCLFSLNFQFPTLLLLFCFFVSLFISFLWLFVWFTGCVNHKHWSKGHVIPFSYFPFL